MYAGPRNPSVTVSYADMAKGVHRRPLIQTDASSETCVWSPQAKFKAPIVTEIAEVGLFSVPYAAKFHLLRCRSRSMLPIGFSVLFVHVALYH